MGLPTNVGGAGIQSDQLLRPRTTTYHPVPGAVAVAVRESPDYWTGNLLVLEAPPRELDPAPWRAIWAREVGQRSGAAHPLVQFELPWAARHDVLSSPAHARVQWDTVLRAPLSMAGSVASRTPGLAIDDSRWPTRPIATEHEWAAVRGLMALDELDPDAAADVAGWQNQFLDWRLGMYRARVQDGEGALFGAWDGGALIGVVGLMWSEALRLARYQCVLTHPTYRRQGICGRLLAQAHGHLAPRGWPTIIVSDHASTQERLYTRLGFEPVSVRGTWHLEEAA
jgi:GNAT superfamily N-acetyltransferase